MLRNSEADVIQRDPLQLRLIHTPEFKEEQRQLSGVLVNRTYPEVPSKQQEKVLRKQRASYRNARGNGAVAKARVIRTRVPRNARIPESEDVKLHKLEFRQRYGYEAR